MPVSDRPLKLRHAQCLLWESSALGKSEPEPVLRQAALVLQVSDISGGGVPANFDIHSRGVTILGPAG